MREGRKTYEGYIYHICNKSIANFNTLKSPINAVRFIKTLDYYNSTTHTKRFSDILREEKEYQFNNLLFPKTDRLVKFLSYIIMPDHYHILVKVLAAGSVSKYIGNVENSFTRFFNLKNNRKGPLWQSRFRLIRIKSDEQLLHVSRYIHLNATTAGLVENPEDWEYSSYQEYIGNSKILGEIITEIMIKNSTKYKKFVEDRKDYQKKLKMIKKQLLE